MNEPRFVGQSAESQERHRARSAPIASNVFVLVLATVGCGEATEEVGPNPSTARGGRSGSSGAGAGGRAGAAGAAGKSGGSTGGASAKAGGGGSAANAGSGGSSAKAGSGGSAANAGSGSGGTSSGNGGAAAKGGGGGASGTGGAAGGGQSGGSGGSPAGGSAGASAACGDAACNVGVTCSTCPGDCGVCPPSCGDAACNGGETCTTCPADCGVCPPSCGDTACNGGETCATCPGDCGACPPTEVAVGGGDCKALQGGLDQAAAAGLPLRLAGAFTVNCAVRIPSNVQINGQAATFTFTKAGRIRNQTNGGAGAYSHAGGFVWDGGTFVGAGNGVFTISHSPGFTIKNTVQYAYADAGDDGHSIEVNSSGGPHAPDKYSVHITGNTFRGVTGQRSNANDEPIQYDFAWDGSGGDAPFDATMTHNLYIAYNTFHRLDESGTWQFALCAIGGHRGGAGEPAERHNGFLIEFNQIHGAVGATANISPNKGAIALWNARDVWIRNNGFHGCTGSRLISGWDANPDRDLDDATMNINISGNTHNGSAVTISMPASNTTGGLRTLPLVWCAFCALTFAPQPSCGAMRYRSPRNHRGPPLQSTKWSG